MTIDNLEKLTEDINTITDLQIKGLYVNAINELNLHERKTTSNLQKIKNAIRPFSTPNRDKLIDFAINLSGYIYENIDQANPYYLQKYCEFLLLRKDIDTVISVAEKFLLDAKEKHIDKSSIEFITITLASAYSWKDKKFLKKAIKLLENLNSKSLRVLDNLAKFYYNNSQFNEVIDLALESKSLNSQFALWYGKSLFQIGKTNEAIDVLEDFTHDRDVAKFLEQIRIQKKKATPSAKGNTLKVFISYSRIDSEYADNLVNILNDLGVQYFLDRKDIEWGGDITNEVNRGLSDCDAIIVIVSPASLKSQWVPYEIGRASGQNKKVLPLLTHPSLDLPGYIQHLNYITSMEDAKTYFDKFTES